MLKGRPHLCQYMPKRKDARRLVADPDNEPNFYKITEQFPLDLPTTGASTEEPETKRARFENYGVAAAAPPVASVSVPQVTSPLDGINSASVLMALLEAKRKQEEEQKKQQVMLETVATLLQGVHQPQQTQQAMMQQQSGAQPDAANLQALLGLLNQMN